MFWNKNSNKNINTEIAQGLINTSAMIVHLNEKNIALQEELNRSKRHFLDVSSTLSYWAYKRQNWKYINDNIKYIPTAEYKTYILLYSEKINQTNAEQIKIVLEIILINCFTLIDSYENLIEENRIDVKRKIKNELITVYETLRIILNYQVNSGLDSEYIKFIGLIDSEFTDFDLHFSIFSQLLNLLHEGELMVYTGYWLSSVKSLEELYLSTPNNNVTNSEFNDFYKDFESAYFS